MAEPATMLVGTTHRLSAAARSIRPSGIRRFFDLINGVPDVLSLGVGEPDQVVPAEIRMAAVAAIMEGQTRYTANAGTLELREAIAAYLSDHIGVSYSPAEEVVVTAGVAQGIDLALRALVNPGDEVLIPEPCFVSYGPCTELAGGRPVGVPLSAASGFRLTPEQLRRHVTPRTRVLLMSFPSNPTGAVLTQDDLAAVAEVVHQYDLTVISDEIYSELTYRGTHHSIAALRHMRNRTIVLNGFSKTFAMTGWRLGYAAGPAPLIQGMARIHQHALMCASTVAQLAGVHALARAREIADMARTLYRQRRDYLHQALLSMNLPCVEPQGAFYLFPSIGRTGLTDEEFAERLLQEERVVTVPGSAFGPSGRGHVRLSYAASLETLERAVDRMQRFVHRVTDV